jgi:hypothetical protein
MLTSCFFSVTSKLVDHVWWKKKDAERYVGLNLYRIRMTHGEHGVHHDQPSAISTL